jgi:hypothetical protein
VEIGVGPADVSPRSKREREERERREWAEKGQRLKDLEEDFSAAKLAGTLTDALRNEMSRTRRAYRQEGEDTGKRAGMVAVTTIWWARWLEVGIDHELEARRAFRCLTTEQPNSDALLGDFHNALVAVCSAAFAVEAIHNDFEYRIPEKDWGKRWPSEVQLIGYGLRTGWPLEDPDDSRLGKRLKALLNLRASAAHAYTESLPASPHPAGLNTGAEHALFNAVTAGEAIDLALDVVALTGGDPNPNLPAPHDRWLRRWVQERRPYRDLLAEMARERDFVPLDHLPS